MIVTKCYSFLLIDCCLTQSYLCHTVNSPDKKNRWNKYIVLLFLNTTLIFFRRLIKSLPQVPFFFYPKRAFIFLSTQQEREKQFRICYCCKFHFISLLFLYFVSKAIHMHFYSFITFTVFLSEHFKFNITLQKSGKRSLQVL